MNWPGDAARYGINPFGSSSKQEAFRLPCVKSHNRVVACETKEPQKTMSQLARPRNYSTFVLAASLVGSVALGVFAPGVAHAGDDACTTTKFHYPSVEKACKAGGRKGAKDVMKAAVHKAKDAGKDMKCTSCHEDTKAFKLKDNAVADLKPWI
jgi:hypothetical protein